MKFDMFWSCVIVYLSIDCSIIDLKINIELL